jgi:hypothetical protein
MKTFTSSKGSITNINKHEDSRGPAVLILLCQPLLELVKSLHNAFPLMARSANFMIVCMRFMDPEDAIGTVFVSSSMA